MFYLIRKIVKINIPRNLKWEVYEIDLQPNKYNFYK